MSSMANLNKICRQPGCSRTIYSLEVCLKHYPQAKKLLEFSKQMHPASRSKHVAAK